MPTTPSILSPRHILPQSSSPHALDLRDTGLSPFSGEYVYTKTTFQVIGDEGNEKRRHHGLIVDFLPSFLHHFYCQLSKLSIFLLYWYHPSFVWWWSVDICLVFDRFACGSSVRHLLGWEYGTGIALHWDMRIREQIRHTGWNTSEDKLHRKMTLTLT
jgi:hypothetical protein